MAAQAEIGSGGSGGGKDDVKTQFATREGTYRLMTLAEYSRPNRAGCGAAAAVGAGGSSVRVSLVTLPPETGAGAATIDSDAASDERICFNHGKELFVYLYRGLRKAPDMSKPIDKKMYKGTNPTCHDFNTATATQDSVSLVIGFSTGQIQLIDPIRKELSKLYNEERLIDKSKVTCIRWVPGSSNLFIASHASGALYVYNEELGCGTAAPHYQQFKTGDSYAVFTCRAKSTRNPLYRWSVGAEGSAINHFAFSPCGSNLAVVSQDGFLRVFHYDTMELVGRARSYFGGFLCSCWSPDGKYVVVGGEDDLITVWSFADRRVVARGQGHRSWVSVVAFDPYCFGCGDASTSDDEDGTRTAPPCYRLGSVSQDTQLCLWDLTEDVLRPPVRARASAHLSPSTATAAHHTPAASPNGVPGVKLPPPKTLKSNKIGHKNGEGDMDISDSSKNTNAKKEKSNNVQTLNITVGRTDGGSGGSLGVNSLTQRLAGFSFGDRREHRRNFSLSSKPSESRGVNNSVAMRGKSAGGAVDAYDPLKLIGTPACPRFDECPVLEPLVCKKIAHERLTSLEFRGEAIVTACADGCVYTWARPTPAPARPHNGELQAPPGRLHLVD